MAFAIQDALRRVRAQNAVKVLFYCSVLAVGGGLLLIYSPILMS